MKKTGLTLFIGLISLFGYGQNYRSENIDSIFIYSKIPSESKITFLENCENATIIAEQDIKNQKILILIVGGIAPIVYKSDIDFEKKYKITFTDYGDLPAKDECILNYNFRVFDYLTEKFGNNWKRVIRKDVYGLKEWKKKKRHITNRQPSNAGLTGK